jgi:hypothetical protein
MVRFAAILILALGLAACDAVNTATEGFSNANAVARDLEASTGMRPEVGFNWKNGRLAQVTVSYSRINETKPLHELAEAVRAAVAKEFKQKPDNIVLAFALGG